MPIAAQFRPAPASRWLALGAALALATTSLAAPRGKPSTPAAQPAAPPAAPKLPPDVQARLAAAQAAQAAKLAYYQRRAKIAVASGEGRLREADKLARETLADAEKTHGKQSPELALPLQDAARAAEMLGEMKRALASIRAASG